MARIDEEELNNFAGEVLRRRGPYKLHLPRNANTDEYFQKDAEDHNFTSVTVILEENRRVTLRVQIRRTNPDWAIRTFNLLETGDADIIGIEKQYNSALLHMSIASSFDPAPKRARGRGLKPRNSPKWMGARGSGLPFKVALELFLDLNAGTLKHVNRETVLAQDPALYRALNNYETRFGALPYPIPSRRDNARAVFEKAAKEGLDALPRRERDSAIKTAHRRQPDSPKK